METVGSKRKGIKKMAQKLYRIGIGLILAVILMVSIYLLYRENRQEKKYEDGVLVEREQETATYAGNRAERKRDTAYAGNGTDKNRWERGTA